MEGPNIIRIIVFLMMPLNGQVSSVGMSRQEVIELGKSYCPSIPFCTNNDTDGHEESCCFPCSCDESCVHTKTCCPDVSLTSRLPEVRTSCEDGYIMNDFYETVRENKNRITPLPDIYYEMVVRCSDGRMCPSLETNVEFNVEDLVAVVSRRDETLFKNKKCAECNGVYDYKRWQLLIVECNNNIESIENYWMMDTKPCVLLSYPSQGDPEWYLCPGSDINVCNVTNEWDVFDVQLEEACLNPFSGRGGRGSGTARQCKESVPIASGFEDISYKNVFCFLCNHPSNITSNISYSIHPNRCKGHDTSSSRSAFDSFSTLLQFNFDHVPALNTKAIGENTYCKDSEILDTFHNVCRTLHCFDDLEPRHGKCVIPAVQMLHKTYSLEIGLYPLSTEIIWVNTDTMFLQNEDFLVVLSRKLHISNCEIQSIVNSITSRVYLNDNGLQYINIDLAISKAAECQYMSIVQNIIKLKLRREQMTLLLNSRSVEFVIELSQRWKYTGMSGGYAAIKGAVENRLYMFEILKQPYACPYIVLTESSYCTIVQHYYNVSDLSLTKNSSCPLMFDTALSDSTYSVCIDTFAKLVEPLGSGTVSTTVSCVSLLGIVVSYVIYLCSHE